MLQDGKEIRSRMYFYLKDRYGGALAPSWSPRQMLETAYTFKEAEKQFKELQRYIKLDKKMRILDAGCGFGHFVSLLLGKGHNCQGYEVDPRLTKIAKELLAKNKQDPESIKQVDGKTLPYPPKSFDLINLHFVLDYVNDIPYLLREIKRILKDNGQVFIIAPNYQCCYSPVYALIFIPWLPRFVNRIYFRLMGRPNTKFLENLNFITPKYVEKVFENCGYKINNLGLKYWEDLITGKKLANRGKFLKFLVKSFQKLKLTWLLRWVGKIGFYTPLVYVLEKREQ